MRQSATLLPTDAAAPEQMEVARSSDGPRRHAPRGGLPCHGRDQAERYGAARNHLAEQLLTGLELRATHLTVKVAVLARDADAPRGPLSAICAPRPVTPVAPRIQFVLPWPSTTASSVR
ncbi:MULTISPECIES: hypothetical protein [Streptomyces]|uniref:hypothetical protein n=1 Tax=Streptomyces TaxID=1883 RepID=UPI001E314529|nr:MULTISPECIES: hypothetical protein [Streptomyces]UFQ13572.1 hypothetical protein J2N69_00220 [Streptomyces huasconensis]WCL83169.1 hypothetical protein PPN52_00215 [Streptomyces sp. JCM 35825]